MTDLEAIALRRSCRSYLKEPLPPEAVEGLRAEIELVNQEGGLTCALLEDGSAAFASMGKTYGLFSGVRTLLVLKGPAGDGHLRENAGYYGQRLILAATKLGLGSCWVGGTYDAANPVLGLAAGEELVCVAPVGLVPDARGLKERMIHRMAHRSPRPVEKFYQADEEVPDWFLAGIEAVRRAPSALNSQKVRFAWKGGRASVSIPGDYLFDLVDLGIAKLHFELAAGGQFPLGNPVYFEKA